MLVSMRNTATREDVLRVVSTLQNRGIQYHVVREASRIVVVTNQSKVDGNDDHSLRLLPAVDSLINVTHRFKLASIQSRKQRTVIQVRDVEIGGETAVVIAGPCSVESREQLPAAPLSYYYELDQTYYSVTSTTFVGSLLGLLDMRSIADAARDANGGYPQLSSEFIIKANPDFVILADTICCSQDRATVDARPGWSVMRAVKSGHIIGLNDDIASRWGPRVVDLLRVVANAVRRAEQQGTVSS